MWGLLLETVVLTYVLENLNISNDSRVSKIDVKSFSSQHALDGSIQIDVWIFVSDWKWQSGIKYGLLLPCCPVSLHCPWKETLIEKKKKTYLFDASLLEETPDRSNSRIWESFLWWMFSLTLRRLPKSVFPSSK